MCKYNSFTVRFRHPENTADSQNRGFDLPCVRAFQSFLSLISSCTGSCDRYSPESDPIPRRNRRYSACSGRIEPSHASEPRNPGVFDARRWPRNTIFIYSMYFLYFGPRLRGLHRLLPAGSSGSSGTCAETTQLGAFTTSLIFRSTSTEQSMYASVRDSP